MDLATALQLAGYASKALSAARAGGQLAQGTAQLAGGDGKTMTDLSNAIRGLGYAGQGLNLANLGGQIGSVATQSLGSTMGPVGITPAVGLGAVAAPIALALLTNGLINTGIAKSRGATRSGQGQQMSQVGRFMSAPEGTPPSSWLGQDVSDIFGWQANTARRGDLLSEILKRNLRGDWLMRAQGPGGAAATFDWAPNEKYRPLAAVLQAGGYNRAVPDPTGIISRAGGWDTGRDRYGLPQMMNTNAAVDNWEKLFDALSAQMNPNVPQALLDRVPMMSRGDVLKAITNPGDAGQGMREYYPSRFRETTPEPINLTGYTPELHNAIAIAHNAGFGRTVRDAATEYISQQPRDIVDALTRAWQAERDWLGPVSPDAAP